MSEKFDRFVNLLRNIFELDKSDLDFGIYRIMNIRKEQIDDFLSKRLPDQVRNIIAPTADNTEKISKRMGELKEMASLFKADVKQNEEYMALKELSLVSHNISALETDVYSYLYNFFCRYYDEGDFISKRRYKEGVYSIPYEGEEVKLYWANHDQYYIKTAENFKDYSFIYNDITIHFMLVDATTEQNNNKENGKKRAFMLFTENAGQPDIKTFELKENKFIIRFIYDLSDENQKSWNEKNYNTIKKYIIRSQDNLIPLITPSIIFSKETISPIQKHLLSYIAKNTFDYFIHKDLGGFLKRELDFFIKNEFIHIDDIDTFDIRYISKYIAKIRAIKKVGLIIIDFLAQIENFQKRLWLKKKFIVRTDWCITLDKVPVYFYEEIAKNKAQVQEWIELYAIDDEITGDLDFTVKWSNPPSVEFLKANQNLVIDTKHFSLIFKEKIISEIDDLDETTSGILIHSENFQALNMLQEKYKEKIEAVHIDPPYNTDTSGFIYKNNYRHSSWLSMLTDRIDLSICLLTKTASFITHIDENEYERLWQLFDTKPMIATGTIIWDKRNPMTGGTGIATQHEYIIWRDMGIKTVNILNGAAEMMLQKVKELEKKYGCISDELRKEYILWINSNNILSSGEKSYRYIDDNGNIYQSVSLRAPEPRTDPKFHIPLIHPKTNKPCPVPPNGFSRTPETMKNMMERGEILFGEDETTQPRQKSILNIEKVRQLSSVIQDATRGKTDLSKLGLDFPYNHSVSLYEHLIASAINGNTSISLDYFAGSATTGHAVINLNRQDDGSRKYILVEMGDYFNSVTKPRMKKVAYAKDWKDGKPVSRDTGVSHLMKYFQLESYEDALTNIEFENAKKSNALAFGDEYLIHYMLNTETKGSLLNIGKFNEPFEYRLKITEKNEVKETPVDLPETFNYLIGLNVKRQDTIKYFNAVKNGNKEYEGSVDLVSDNSGVYYFKQIEGYLNDNRKVLIIWRNITSNLIESNAALDAYFLKSRINATNRDYDIIYVNGDNNLQNIRSPSETWKVIMTEEKFFDKMFEE